jgi:predicted DNA-binding transcriptional regulator AlpA
MTLAQRGAEHASQSTDLLDCQATRCFFGGIHASTLYRGIAAGRYPRPIHVGPNTSRWLRSECEAALRAMIEARRAAQ